MQNAELAEESFPGFAPTGEAKLELLSNVASWWEPDDGLDFLPTAHPDRELLTASLFVLVIMTFLVWGGWEVISLILSSL